MSDGFSKGSLLLVVGLVLTVFGIGPRGPSSALAAVLPSPLALLAGLVGVALVVFGTFLQGLPTRPENRTWVPDEDEMDDWERDGER